MLLWTADGSGLFLPYRFGKLVMIVSLKWLDADLDTYARSLKKTLT